MTLCLGVGGELSQDLLRRLVSDALLSLRKRHCCPAQPCVKYRLRRTRCRIKDFAYRPHNAAKSSWLATIGWSFGKARSDSLRKVAKPTNSQKASSRRSSQVSWSGLQHFSVQCKQNHSRKASVLLNPFDCFPYYTRMGFTNPYNARIVLRAFG